VRERSIGYRRRVEQLDVSAPLVPLIVILLVNAALWISKVSLPLPPVRLSVVADVAP
jgi:hypothetical protein